MVLFWLHLQLFVAVFFGLALFVAVRQGVVSLISKCRCKPAGLRKKLSEHPVTQIYSMPGRTLPTA